MHRHRPPAPRNGGASREKGWITAALLLGAALSALVIVFSLRTLTFDFGLRAVPLDSRQTSETPGSRLDQALLRKLETFSYTRSFDRALGRRPQSLIIDGLWVDKCEVRQADFQKFTQWRKINRNAPIAAPDEPPLWEYQSSNKDHVISGRLDAPANGVTYYDAYAYCTAVGGRLPYSDEWVAIASGQQQRLYPWGDSYTAVDWPYLDPLLNAAQKCGANKETATPQGVQNMGSLVSEWAEDRDAPGQPQLHGGNGYNQPYEIYSLNSLYRRAPPTYRSAYAGFRCVYDRRPRLTPWTSAIEAAAVPAGTYETGMPSQARLPNMLTGLPREWIRSLRTLMSNDRDTGPRTLYMMTREVTRRQYARFLADPLAQLGLYADKNQPAEHNYLPDDWELQKQVPELPVSNIDWWSARAFANWAGGRLPTAREWTAALSSQGQFLYPWGNDFLPGLAITGDMGLNSPQIPGPEHTDTTPLGLLDMAGNLSEWTQSVNVTDGGYSILVKGGNYLLPGAETARLDFSAAVPPAHRSTTIGMRLVFDRKLF